MPKINANILIALRESRGISQAELSEQLNISQSNLSRIEQGSLEPTNSTISQVVNILNYNQSILFSKYSIYPLGIHFYRKNKTLQLKYIKTIEALINIKRISIQHLLESIEINSNYKNLKFNEFLKPYEIAIECRKQWKIPSGAITNLFSYIENAGILICYLDDLNFDGFSGVSTFLENQDIPIIFINAQMPPDRIKFTVVHELAHVLLHEVPTPTAEDESNEFTSEFLLPRYDVKSDLENLNINTLPILKKKWQVSMSFLIKRARELNCITQHKYKSLYTVLNKYGYKKTEPYQELIIKEYPILLNQFYKYYLNTLNHSIEEVSNLCGMTTQEIKKEYVPQNDDTNNLTLELIKF